MTATDQGVVIAIDAGTTGVRSAAVDVNAKIVAYAYREFAQIFPKPGWVEHDAEKIWEATQRTLADLATKVDAPVSAVGITNQRETVVVWDKQTGKPLHNAIVWQDRRTARLCSDLQDAGHLDLIRHKTGLVLDPYFSATKLAWIFDHGGVSPTSSTCAGTIDSWLIYKLTGNSVHASEPSNASRTLLFDINKMSFDAELCELFGVPRHVLGDIGNTSGRFGRTTSDFAFGAGIPISAAVGDQQGALFGQGCFSQGDAKNTYGTGSFVLMNVGGEPPEPASGLLTSVAWTLTDSDPVYCVEGAIFVTGAAVQWLRDGLGIIDRSEDLEPLALRCEDSAGVVFVPALTGLGSPWWDPNARGSLLGLTRGTGRAEIARATIEAMAYSTRDVVDAMSTNASTTIKRLRVDGGACVMDLLLQIQADQLGVNVERPVNQQATVLGSAFLAGLAEGVWENTEQIQQAWEIDRLFEPQQHRADDAGYRNWLRAVERSRDWADQG